MMAGEQRQARGRRGRPGARPGPGRGPGESFDARELVKSGAAYELHCRVTADSAVYDHPGFVLDAYLDSLAPGRRPWRLSCARRGCGSGLRVATGSWTGTRSAGARTSRASCPGEAARVRARIRARDHARAQQMPEMARAMVVAP